MDKFKIILDCDPGHDDAIAIMLAGKADEIDLLGVTVVAGNQTLDKTSKNALRVCEYLDLDVPVYSGCGQPMVRDKQVVSPEIHGETGLDGPNFGILKRRVEEKHGVQFIIDTLMASDGDITLVATGPLTNLAMAMRMNPKIIEKIKQIVIMGGSFQLGNVTPAAEFNILADGEAAHVIFSCGRKVVMVGLDVTRKVLCYPNIIERMKKIENNASKLFEDLMMFFNKTQRKVFGWDGGPLHDPVTIAYLIDQSVLVTKSMYTEVDIRSTQSYGRTNCDFFGFCEKEPNAEIAVEIDVEKFWNIVEKQICKYS
ncbi:nucleoside hydrolase [Clostridium sediminicola]|uniref:nucleoside hydrolase n=1 Tax=Clostridium sediminicola TaxID=3114879 RepID=UPI0031F21151